MSFREGVAARNRDTAGDIKNKWVRFVLITLGCAALVATASCEFPFSLRESEPSTGGRIPVVDPTDPGKVRPNTWKCFLGRDATFYNDQLVPDFIFSVDPIDAAELQQTYGIDLPQWDVMTERDVTSYMLDGERCDLVLCTLKAVGDLQCIPDSEILENTPTTCTIEYNYRFTFDLYDVYRHVAGQVRLFIRQEPSDNLWHISKWEDIRPQSGTDRGDTVTLGMLKGELLATK